MLNSNVIDFPKAVFLKKTSSKKTSNTPMVAALQTIFKSTYDYHKQPEYLWRDNDQLTSFKASGIKSTAEQCREIQEHIRIQGLLGLVIIDKKRQVIIGLLTYKVFMYQDAYLVPVIRMKGMSPSERVACRNAWNKIRRIWGLQ
jgi:hypothetical protein